MRNASLLVPLMGMLIFAGCSSGITGKYADEGNVTSYQFHRDGRVTVSVLGTTVAADYMLEGDRILVTSPQGTVVLKRNGDRLVGPMGLELVKQSE